MAIIDVNTSVLKSTVRNNLDLIASDLNSVRSNAETLLVPYDFKYCKVS